MARIRVVASGTSDQARAHARGKLFEKIMANVLRQCGIMIDEVANRNYTGMEIDVVGRTLSTSLPVYAECKYSDTLIDSPKLQAFYGKYMARWFKDNRCQGLFICLPGLNSHAKAFYEENCRVNTQISVGLLEEENILDIIYKAKSAARPEQLVTLIPPEMGTPGDWLLLATESGLFWIQYIIPKGGGIPTGIIFFDDKAQPITDKVTIEYIINLYPELNDFNILTIDSPNSTVIAQSDPEEIVEVRGSSACFEYQFPASPEFFVGRQPALEAVDQFVNDILRKKTSSRGILFEANSGWGKSSLVLASVARLNKNGHFAVAIDSRTASSSQFILRVIQYVYEKFGGFQGLLIDQPKNITGFEGGVDSLLKLGTLLENHNKVLIIFLDQFENIFYLPDALRRIRDLFLKLSDSQSNIALGFSWKTDLIGLTNEFPYQMRDDISCSSRRITLNTFSDLETNMLLDRLGAELRARLRRDLRFILSEFSQGYPWLLKKLCAHVKAQREAGVPQSEIANGLLNIEQLFQEDMRGLSAEEYDALKRIAKTAPVSIAELDKDFSHEVVQSLVNRRLIVKVGNKYDIYWDIFRDYLNSGHIPAQENYILRMQVGSILKAAKQLAEAKGTLDIDTFKNLVGLTDKSSTNVIRDMRLLGLVQLEDDKIKLQINVGQNPGEFEQYIQNHLKDRLRRSRLGWRLIEKLETTTVLKIEEIAGLLEQWCPYISATKETWRTYARIYAGWIDFAGIGIYDSSESQLVHYTSSEGLRERDVWLGKRRGGRRIPCIQYSPVEKIFVRLIEAARSGKRVDMSGFKKSTVTKALATLEDLGLIVRKQGVISLDPRVQDSNITHDKIPVLFAERVLTMDTFKVFIGILDQYKDVGCSMDILGNELRNQLGVNWTNGTAITNAKILLDWARHTKLAPGVFSHNRKNAKKQEIVNVDFNQNI